MNAADDTREVAAPEEYAASDAAIWHAEARYREEGEEGTEDSQEGTSAYFNARVRAAAFVLGDTAPEEYAAWEAADSAFQAANTALEETALKALIPEL